MSLYQEQKMYKPKIEDIIPEYLDVEMGTLALDFIAGLRTSKINPAWTLTNQWKAVCKGKNIVRIGLGSWNPSDGNKKWVVVTYLQHLNSYANTIMTEGDNIFGFMTPTNLHSMQ